jgi:hypothetical protein
MLGVFQSTCLVSFRALSGLCMFMQSRSFSFSDDWNALGCKRWRGGLRLVLACRGREQGLPP